jgi:ribosomal protein S18 acetylase RimI-like enzyme
LILPYDDKAHREPVIGLWRDVFGYTTARNDPALSLSKKLETGDGLLFVAVEENHVIGTIMAGYDGHRGWLYALAVRSESRGRGIGAALVRRAESELAALGCLKINLQVVAKNGGVTGFYESLGYKVEPRISMGKSI